MQSVLPLSRSTEPSMPPPGVRVRLDALSRRQVLAERWLVETHTPRVGRVILGIAGSTSDVDSLVDDVFLRFLARLEAVHSDAAIASFLVGIAVRVAREELRRRRRKRWLHFFAPGELPDPLFVSTLSTHDDAAAALHEVLTSMGDELRIVFCLRHVEGLELAEVSQATEDSLSTVKRRLQEAERLFVSRARVRPELRTWMKEGKWAPKSD